MDDSTLVTAIEQHEAEAETLGTLQEERIKSLEFYQGRPLGNEVEGRSQVIYRSVFDTVEWIKPQLADIFTSGEDIVSFTPRGPEDVAGAEQETDYTNWIVTGRNPWFDIFLGWAHDALVQKVGYVKAYWDDSEDEITENYSDLTEAEYLNLMQNKDIEVVALEEKIAGIDPLTGLEIMSYTARINRTKPNNVVRIVNIAPENTRVSRNARNLSLQDPRLDFFEHRELKTISELREDGFDVADDIADGGESASDYEAALRDPDNPLGDYSGDTTPADPSMRRVWVREVWIRFDKNGDGKAELLHAFVVGTTVLSCEETDHVGVVALCPMPQPHQHHGLSIADAVMDLQRIQTALLRGALDNQYLANNGRYGINTKTVNMDDMLDSRAGGVVRVDGEVGNSFFPLTHPTNGQVAIPMMEYMEKVSQRRTGVTEMSQGLDPNALNNQAGANANSSMITAAQQRIRFIARTFAETGVRNLFQLVHMLSLKHSREQELIEIRGKWIPVNPREWVKRKDMRVNLTLGTGDKVQQITMLQAIGMAQKEGLAIGITRPQNLYHTATKLTQLMGHRNTSEFWVDPGPEPMQPPKDPRLQIEEMKIQDAQNRFEAEIQKEIQIEQVRSATAMEQKRAELELQASNDMRDGERALAQAEYEQQRALEEIASRERIEAAKIEHDHWKTEYNAAVQLQTEYNAQMKQPQEQPAVKTESPEPSNSQQQGEMLGAILKVINAPKEVIRDAQGNMIGVQPKGF